MHGWLSSIVFQSISPPSDMIIQPKADFSAIGNPTSCPGNSWKLFKLSTCQHVSMFNRFVTILVSWQHFRLTLSSSYSVFWTQRIMVHAAIFFAMVDCSKVFLRQKFASLLVSSYWIASKGLVVLEFTLDTFAILVFDLSYLESFSRSNLVATCSLSFVSIDFSQDTVD